MNKIATNSKPVTIGHRSRPISNGMKTQYVRAIPRALTLSICALFLLTGEAQAYTTTDQQAFTLDGTMGVYFIEYAFGHESHDIHMPFMSEHSEERHESALSYAFYDDEGERAGGNVTAIILGNVPIADGEYVIPKGSVGTFTLLVFFTPESDGDYRLQVTELPFSFNGTQELQLNPSELQYYQTEPLTL